MHGKSKKVKKKRDRESELERENSKCKERKRKRRSEKISGFRVEALVEWITRPLCQPSS
jgi:hypothetical protein